MFFFGATGAAYVKTHLIEVDRKNDTVLLCINDDLASTDPKEVNSLDDVLKAWMDGRWPDRMGIERVGEVNRLCIRYISCAVFSGNSWYLP